MTADHIFAREFVPVERRAGLPIVPACERCNNDKSKLEHYLATVLGFGGMHPDAGATLAEIERRLAKNAKLHRELSAGQEISWEPRGGLLLPAMRLPFQTDKLEALARMWARGLALNHFGVVIPADHHVMASMMTGTGDRLFREYLGILHGNRIAQNIGDGAFEYEGLQGVQDICVTAWRITVYGGIRLTGDPAAPSEEARHMWALTSKTDAAVKALAREPA